MTERDLATEVDRIKAVLRYHPEEGTFVWLESRGKVKAGETAGCKNVSGYIKICLGRRYYLAHRLAWLFAHGRWPEKHIDHINGDKADNRIANLRLATNAENQQNVGLRRTNTSGHKGVSISRETGRWYAGIRFNGKWRRLGYFATKELAAAAYKAAAEEFHGQFAVHNRSVATKAAAPQEKPE